MAKQDGAAEEREFAFHRREFNYLARLVYEHSGIVLGEHKQDMVYSRLARRLRVHGFDTFKDYCDLIQGPEADAEMSALINAVTTNLTSFFREGHHFQHLREKLLRPLVQRSRRLADRRRLRIWSSACSSGPEPYSLAMTLAASLPDLRNWDARILATDLDTSMLEVAQAGRYPAKEAEKIPEPLLRRFVSFDRRDGQIEMSGALKELITFNPLNLLRDWPIRGPFDAILCRNVMIYFDAQTRAKLIDRFAGLLREDGYLYLGHAESQLGNRPGFESEGNSIFRRVAP